MNLIDKQVLATLTHKLIGNINQRVGREIKIISRDIEHLNLLPMLMNVLQKQGRLANATGAHQAEHLPIPIDLMIHVAMKVSRHSVNTLLHDSC